MVASGVLIAKLARVDKSGIVFSPVAWLLVAYFVYYGIGALFHVYAGDEAIAISDTFFAISELELSRANILNTVGLAVTLTAFSAFGVFQRRKTRQESFAEPELLFFGVLFGVIGGCFLMLTTVLRATYGRDFIMPGIFYSLTGFANASIFILTYLHFRKVSSSRLPLIILSLFFGAFAVASLMKQQVIELGIAFFLGRFAARPSIRFVAVTVVAGILTLPVLQAVTTFGRIVTWTEEKTTTSLTEIVGAVSLDEWSTYSEVAQQRGLTEIWRRLSQSPSQVFAMNAYDSGLEGESFSTILWILVPRIFFPEKPIITQGEEFTTLVLGDNLAGGTGPGFFGEGYWNFGWAGVIFVAVVLGMLLSIFNQLNLYWVETKQFVYAPIIFMALKFGYRPDDWFVATTFSSVVIMTCFYFILKALVSVKS